MAHRRLNRFVGQLRHLVTAPASGSVGDGHLLDRFALAGEEAAFTALMRRHGPMVLGVCRRVLRNEADVEDTFQATFLTLVRNVSSIRKRESVGSWLHGVAYRLARRALAERARRQMSEQRPSEHTLVDPGVAAAWRELQEILDGELQRLPEKYRLPLVLHYLECATQEEVARRLGWPVGTVGGRLARGRDLLRKRLARRGLTLGVGPFAALLAVNAASASVPPSLAAASSHLAWQSLWGPSAADASLRVIALAESLARTWYLAKLKLVMMLLATGLLAAGAGVVILKQQIEGKPEPKRPEAPTVVAITKPLAAPARPPQPSDILGDPLPNGVQSRLGTTRLRAGRQLYGFTFSPNGKAVAAAGESAVFLWDAATGKEIRKFVGHEGRVFPVAFSPNGTELVTGGGDHTVRIWDTNTGQELRRLDGHRGPVGGVVFSPDGELLVSGGMDKTVRVWDTASGKELRQLGRANQNEPLDHFPYAFLPDGRTVATFDQKNAVYFWDGVTGKELRHFDPKLAPFDRVALSRDGTLLAAAPRGKAGIRRWDVTTGMELSPCEGHEGAVNSLAFSPDGRTLATSSSDRTLRYWDTVTGAELRRVGLDHGQDQGLAFSPDGRTLASGQLGTIRLWEVESGREVQEIAGHRAQIRLIAFTPDGRSVLSGGKDNLVCWWDATTTRLAAHWRGGPGQNVTALALTPDGNVLACCDSPDGVISLREARTGQELQRLRGHAGTRTSIDILHAAFAPDGRTLLSGGFDRTVRLWDVALAREIRRFPGDLPQISAVAFSACGKVVAVGGVDGTIHVWDVGTGESLHRFTDQSDSIRALTFSPDSATLAAAHGRHYAGGDGVIALWDVQSGNQRARLDGHSVRSHAVAFSPNGRVLASAGADCKVRLWELATGREIATLDGHHGAVTALAFSPDGCRLASGGADTTVLVWPVHVDKDRTNASGSSE